MTRPLTVVMLAGTIRPSALRTEVDVPLLCLPMGRAGTILHAWLAVLETLGSIEQISIVLNSRDDVEAVTAGFGSPSAGPGPLRPIAEPAAWRGAGGILRDVTREVDENTIVMAVESGGLPPRGLHAVVDAFDDRVEGVVGVCGEDRPAGVYAFTRRAIERIPPVGYFDMKEQFLPVLRADDQMVKAVWLEGSVKRVRDRSSYLAAVRESMGPDVPATRISDHASVSGSAILDGHCIVESGAVVEDGAVVHDSVVLAGATIGGGAIVSRSILGPLAAVEPRTRVVRSIVSAESMTARPVRPARHRERVGRGPR